MLMMAALTILSVSVFAQDTTKHKAKTQMESVTYSCPMHPEVTSTKPGKCSKCGMELTRAKTYSCSMHPEITSTKPGKCSKCGMELTEVKTSPKKMKM